ncbi:MAG: 50S ribosomal protein L5 [bacterium]
MSAEVSERVIPRLLEKYRKEVVPEIMRRRGYRSPMRVPRIEKVVVHMGLGDMSHNPKAMESGMKVLQAATGQKPVIRRAKKSVAAFKVRAGAPVGLLVTLRGKRMYYFLEKLIHIVLPRFKDFSGLPFSQFDGRGNYTIGVKEQMVFPEVSFADIDRVRGMNISIVTTSKNDEEAGELLKLLGFPLKEEE